MHKIYAQIISALIWNKEKKKTVRKVLLDQLSDDLSSAPYIKIRGHGNKIYLLKDGQKIELSESMKIQGLSIIMNGNNNTIYIADNINFYKRPTSKIMVLGNNNMFSIQKTDRHINNVTFRIECDGSQIKIGNNLLYNGGIVTVAENNTSVSIGNDCMFSDHVELMSTDSHTIFDDEYNIINKANSIDIGNHVWLGAGSKILKNVKLADNIIVGAGSVVAKSFNEQNVAVAGNPAKIIKRNINWDLMPVDKFIKKNLDVKK